MPAVFISYSRKDFYFAESLAFHLDREGIATWLDANHLAPGGDWAAEIDHALDEAQTVVLVLTPDSIRSEYVRREWQRALAQGDRLILALFRSCKPPPELRHARRVDFCGALRRLMQLLATPGKAAAQQTTRLRFPVPPWIGIITVMLALVFFVPMMIFGDWQGLAFTNEPIAFRILYWLALPFFLGFIFWHSCIALLRRRMGMTRLALSLTLFTGVFGFYLLGRTGWIPAVTARTSEVQ
jgi:TIR domain-containing protein